MQVTYMWKFSGTISCGDFGITVVFYPLHRRFDPAFASLKETTQSGSLGELQLLRLTSRDNPKPSYEFLSTTGILCRLYISD